LRPYRAIAQKLDVDMPLLTAECYQKTKSPGSSADGGIGTDDPGDWLK
jgi:hypothetical protein